MTVDRGGQQEGGDHGDQMVVERTRAGKGGIVSDQLHEIYRRGGKIKDGQEALPHHMTGAAVAGTRANKHHTNCRYAVGRRGEFFFHDPHRQGGGTVTAEGQEQGKVQR